MTPIGLHHYLILGALLFVCGALCMANKRNAIGVLMGVELVLNGANINFVAFARFNPTFEKAHPQHLQPRQRLATRQFGRVPGVAIVESNYAKSA